VIATLEYLMQICFCLEEQRMLIYSLDHVDVTAVLLLCSIVHNLYPIH